MRIFCKKIQSGVSNRTTTVCTREEVVTTLKDGVSRQPLHRKKDGAFFTPGNYKVLNEKPKTGKAPSFFLCSGCRETPSLRVVTTSSRVHTVAVRFETPLWVFLQNIRICDSDGSGFRYSWCAQSDIQPCVVACLLLP